MKDSLKDLKDPKIKFQLWFANLYYGGTNAFILEGTVKISS